MDSPGAALAAMRKRAPFRCAICGAERVGTARARYCSNACRQKAKYRRGRAATATTAASTRGGAAYAATGHADAGPDGD